MKISSILRLFFAICDFIRSLALFFWITSLVNPDQNSLFYSTLLWLGVLQFITPFLLLFTSFARDHLYKYNRILAFAKGLNLTAFIFWMQTLSSYYGSYLSGNYLILVQLITPLSVFLFDLILFTLLLWGSKGPKKDNGKDLPLWAETSLEDG